MLIADQLSRSLDENRCENRENLHSKIINFLDYELEDQLKNLAISKSRLENIKKMSRNDDQLKQISKYIMKGWPESKKHCSKIA